MTSIGFWTVFPGFYKLMSNPISLEYKANDVAVSLWWFVNVQNGDITTSLNKALERSRPHKLTLD